MKSLKRIRIIKLLLTGIDVGQGIYVRRALNKYFYTTCCTNKVFSPILVRQYGLEKSPRLINVELTSIQKSTYVIILLQ